MRRGVHIQEQGGERERDRMLLTHTHTHTAQNFNAYVYLLCTIYVECSLLRNCNQTRWTNIVVS